MPHIEVFNPTGATEVTTSFAPRLETLDNKTIGFLSNELWQSHRTFPYLQELLSERHPSLEFVTLRPAAGMIDDEKVVDELVAAGCDAVIVGHAACGGCGTNSGRAAARIEKRGIPTVVLGRNDFVGVIRNAVAGQGLAPEIAMVTFPISLFLGESDLSPIKADLDRFMQGLMAWKPKTETRTTISRPGMVTVEAGDAMELSDQFNRLFLNKGWSDGLPLLPPTRERVRWILQGTDASPDAHIGTLLPRGGIVTMETAAVSLAMAGGRPEYLPVLVAALEAIFDPVINHQHWQATTCSTFPAVIVGGKIAQQIRLNSGFGLLGPDPRHPAGGSIGRALRLLQQNVGGALPGVGTMAAFGGMRYTNAVFAEDEAGLPADWQPFNEEFLGYERGENTVAVAVVASANNIMRRGRGEETLEQEALDGLHRVASYMRAINVNSYEAYADGTPGVLMITRPVAHQMSALGWSKQKIREFLWENTKIPTPELERAGAFQWARRYGLDATLEAEQWPITSKPENLAIVVAGGGHTTHAHWMQTAFAPHVAKARIKLPSRWDELLAQAEKDLAS